MSRFRSVFEREDKGAVQRIEIILGAFVWSVMVWGIANLEFGSQTWIACLIFFSMITFLAIFWVADLTQNKNVYAESVGFGKTEDAKKALVFGLLTAVSLVFLGGTGFIIVPFSVTGIIWLVVLSAFVEEMFFRSVLAPTGARLFQSDLAGWIVNAVGFGLFHWAVYGASFGLIVSAMVFGTIMLAGNTYFKSTLFGYSAHLLFNFLVAGGLFLFF